MSKFRKTTAKTVSKHLRLFADYLDNQDCEFERKAAAVKLNDWLDEWLGEDTFGTEGQLDLRGESR